MLNQIAKKEKVKGDYQLRKDNSIQSDPSESAIEKLIGKTIDVFNKIKQIELYGSNEGTTHEDATFKAKGGAFLTTTSNPGKEGPAIASKYYVGEIDVTPFFMLPMTTGLAPIPYGPLNTPLTNGPVKTMEIAEKADAGASIVEMVTTAVKAIDEKSMEGSPPPKAKPEVAPIPADTFMWHTIYSDIGKEIGVKVFFIQNGKENFIRRFY